MSATGSRAASLRLVGGRASLDLVNTVSWRGDASRREDHLLSAEDAIVWATRAGVVTQPEATNLTGLDPAGLDLLLTSLLELRESLEAFFSKPAVASRTCSRTASGRRSRPAPSMTPREVERVGGPTELGPLTPSHRIVLDAYELSPPGHPTPRPCEDETCGWVFYDTSKSRSRRWCSSQDCGNRERVRRHYQQTHPRERSVARDRG